MLKKGKIILLIAVSTLTNAFADLYIAASDGVYIFSNNTLYGPYLSNLGVKKIAVERVSGVVAFATSRGQVWKYNKDVNSLVGSYHYTDLKINDIAMDASGNVGVASDDGLYRLSLTLVSIAGPVSSDKSFTHIAADVQRSAWASQSSVGSLYGYNNRMDTFMGSPVSVVPNSLGGLVVDSGGSIITVANSGVGYRFENDAANNPFGNTYGPYFSGLDPNTFTIDYSNDNIYTVTLTKAIAVYSADFGAQLGVWNENINAKDMEIDPVQNKLVILTKSNSLLVYDINASGIIGYAGRFDGLNQKTIYQIKATPKTVLIGNCNSDINNPQNGDVNKDCIIDFKDFAKLAFDWFVDY